MTDKSNVAQAEAATLVEKRAPVQGFSAGIPWDMHLRAYDAYCKKWSPQPAMIDLEGRNCRGGFSVGELNDFIPGWREELDERTKLRARIAALEAEHAALSRQVQGMGEALEPMAAIPTAEDMCEACALVADNEEDTCRQFMALAVERKDFAEALRMQVATAIAHELARRIRTLSPAALNIQQGGTE